MICKTCYAWDADDNARFCGHCGACLLPVAFELKPGEISATTMPPGGVKVKLSLPPEGRREIDFQELSLCLRTRPDNRIVASYPLGRTVLNSQSPEQTIALNGDWVQSRAGAGTVVEPLIADSRFAPAMRASRIQPRLRINEPSLAFSVLESEVAWRGESRSLEIPLRLEAGGAACVKKARLILRSGAASQTGVGSGADVELAWPQGRGDCIVEQGAPLLLSFPLPSDVTSKLRAMPAPLEADLDLFDGQSLPIAHLPFTVAHGGPPEPVLAIAPGPVDVLAEHKSRIGIALRNAGGSAFDIQSCKWRLIDPNRNEVTSGEDSVLDFFPKLPFSCAPGQAYYGELAIPLKPGIVTPGLYDVELTLMRSAGAPLYATTSIRVRPVDRILAGQVCIDFGTTESGAAVLFDGKDWPTPVELGRVSFRAGDETYDGEYFVPTIAAASYMPGVRELSWSFGDHALAAVSTHTSTSPERLGAYSRLKWSLEAETETFLPDNSTITILEIAARYIDHLIERLESHPAICARVEHSFITKPAVYKDGQSQMLVRAYEQKRPGFVNWFYNGETGGRMLISESWPPLYAALPAGQELANKTFNRQQIVDQEAFDGGVNIVVLDVGGGSLDVSLFFVRAGDGDIKTYQVQELFSMTSTSFCGGKFAELIDIEIERALVPYLRGLQGGNTFRDLGISVQAENGVVSESAVANSAALARLRAYFQRGGGAYIALDGEIVGFVRKHTTPGSSDISVLTKTIAERVQAWIGSINDPKGIYQRERQIVLQGRDKPFCAPLDDPFKMDLLAHIAHAMDRQYRSELDNMFLRMNAVVQKGPIRVLLTGRGSLFPVANNLLVSHAQQHWPDCKYFIAAELNAKLITSVGGTLVAKDNVEGVPIEFVARSVGILAVIVGRQASREREPIYADFSPNTVDAVQRAGVVPLKRLKRLLQRPDAAIEIVRRYDGLPQHDEVRRFPSKDMGSFNADEDWMALCWRADGGLVVRVVRGKDEEAALRAATGT